MRIKKHSIDEGYWGVVEFLLNKSEPDFEFPDEKYSKQLEFPGVCRRSQKNNMQT